MGLDGRLRLRCLSHVVLVQIGFKVLLPVWGYTTILLVPVVHIAVFGELELSLVDVAVEVSNARWELNIMNASSFNQRYQMRPNRLDLDVKCLC